MSTVKKLTVTALFLALCVALPPLFHAVGLGRAFSPLHIPALACGLICGPLYGLVCGAFGPLLASLINGMPPMAMLLYFIPEMMAYGLFSGLFMKLIRTGSTVVDCVISLAVAMVIGRIVGGLVHGAVFLGGGAEYSLGIWVGAYFIGTWPGMILHIVLIPAIYLALEKAKLIPARYAKKA